jgi:hypothetical protein
VAEPQRFASPIRSTAADFYIAAHPFVERWIPWRKSQTARDVVMGTPNSRRS